MKKLASAKKTTPVSAEPTWYSGRQAKTGNSLGLRFEKSLFHSHPEFNGGVKARVLAPGRMLVVAEPSSQGKSEEDPIIASFLSFLASDMTRSPHRIRPLDAALVARIDRLTKGMTTDQDEDLGDDPMI